MITVALNRRTLSVGAAALLAACGGFQTLARPSAIPAPQIDDGAFPRCKVRVIYTFPPGNGSYPSGYAPGGLSIVDKKLLGMAFYGGRYDNGTVFTMTLSGGLHTIYSFKRSPDGEGPDGSLTIYNGNYYGTTALGGRYDGGTVFELTPSGDERILHSFAGGADGAYPFGGLHMLDGRFYGVTLYGGDSDQNGTVFDITPLGAEHVLHRFGSKSQDYANSPEGILTLNGVLFGTAGTVKHGWGAIFRLTTSGSYKNLHTFRTDEGGYGGIFTWNGAIYGVTHGQFGNRRFHRGAFFELPPHSDQLRLIARIGDSSNKPGGLEPFDGAFFGSIGGGGYGDGEVYKITTAGDESVVCSFHRTLPGPQRPEDPHLGVPYDGKFYAASGPGGDDGGSVYKVSL